MTTLWLLQQSPAGLATYFGLAERTGRHSLVLNQAEALASTRAGRPRVVPRLGIDADLDLDFFEDGLTFASARLLDAMALPVDAAEIGVVDATACAASVRGKEYRTFTLRTRGDAIDRTRSEGGMVAWIDGSGQARSEWKLRAPGPNRPAPRMRWRTDFLPPADLFLVDGTSWRAATEALAARVTAVGATGLNFIDPIASAATGDLVSRPR